jgi:hypothetical protein
VNHAVHNKQVSFIGSISDDCPRDTGVSKEEISKDDNIRGRVFVELGMLKQDAVVALIEQQITKLKEYKITLINRPVTGKIKVPGIVEPDPQNMEVD